MTVLITCGRGRGRSGRAHHHAAGRRRRHAGLDRRHALRPLQPRGRPVPSTSASASAPGMGATATPLPIPGLGGRAQQPQQQHAAVLHIHGSRSVDLVPVQDRQRAFAACTSPYQAPVLSDGSHTFCGARGRLCRQPRRCEQLHVDGEHDAVGRADHRHQAVRSEQHRAALAGLLRQRQHRQLPVQPRRRRLLRLHQPVRDRPPHGRIAHLRGAIRQLARDRERGDHLHLDGRYDAAAGAVTDQHTARQRHQQQRQLQLRRRRDRRHLRMPAGRRQLLDLHQPRQLPRARRRVAHLHRASTRRRRQPELRHQLHLDGEHDAVGRADHRQPSRPIRATTPSPRWASPTATAPSASSAAWTAPPTAPAPARSRPPRWPTAHTRSRCDPSIRSETSSARPPTPGRSTRRHRRRRRSPAHRRPTTTSTSASFSFGDDERASASNASWTPAASRPAPAPLPTPALAGGSHTFLRARTRRRRQRQRADRLHLVAAGTATAGAVDRHQAVRSEQQRAAARWASPTPTARSASSAAWTAPPTAPAPAPFTTAALADGIAHVRSRGRRASRNGVSNPTQYSWTVDTTPSPAPTLTSTPPANDTRQQRQLQLRRRRDRRHLRMPAGRRQLLDLHQPRRLPRAGRRVAHLRRAGTRRRRQPELGRPATPGRCRRRGRRHRRSTASRRTRPT